MGSQITAKWVIQNSMIFNMQNFRKLYLSYLWSKSQSFCMNWKPEPLCCYASWTKTRSEVINMLKFWKVCGKSRKKCSFFRYFCCYLMKTRSKVEKWYSTKDCLCCFLPNSLWDQHWIFCSLATIINSKLGKKLIELRKTSPRFHSTVLWQHFPFVCLLFTLPTAGKRNYCNAHE